MDMGTVVLSNFFRVSINEVLSYFKLKMAGFKINESFNIEEVYLKAMNVEMVKTIWQVDKSVNLNEFYHPSKIICDEEVVEVNSLSSFPENGKVVIQGTAGQGKSILLRYLAGVALKYESRIPLFIELRKVSDDKNIEALILDSLSELGVDISIMDLELVFSSGKFVLLMDAFDEISELHVLKSISYIEKISHKYYSQLIVVTSRPKAEIQKVACFRVFELKPLGSDDFKPILMNFFNDNNTVVEQILNSLKVSGGKVVGLIKTPLLLTLLAITYKTFNKIPTQLNEFYENIFHVLVNRHDSTKPGFIRNYKSYLNERELENLFCAFCFFCMIHEKTSLNRRDAVDIIRKSSELSGVKPSSELSFLSDCIKNTCLIVEEGFDYHFIHKSIREYHSAKFISDSQFGLKEKFYQSSINNWYKYNSEIEFLRIVDEYSYKKLFVFPMLRNAYEVYQGLNISELELEFVFSNCFVFFSKHHNDNSYVLDGFSNNVRGVSDYISRVIYDFDGRFTSFLIHRIEDFPKKVRLSKLESYSSFAILNRDSDMSPEIRISMSEYLNYVETEGVIENMVREFISTIVSDFLHLKNELSKKERLVENMDFLM